MGGLSIGDEGGITRKLWVKSKSQSIFALYTPMIISIASGKLDSFSFIRFISQDLPFLQACTRAYEMAEECADDDDDKTVIRKLRKRTMNKQRKYGSMVQEWGFELPKENISDNTMVKYTDFLLAAASGKAMGERFPGKVATPFERSKLAAYALAAIAPSMRLRAYLSKEIQSLLDPNENSNIYKKWIDSIASQKYEASASQIEELLEKLTISLTGEELEVVEKLYYQALKLEVEFFSKQPLVQRTIVPLLQVHADVANKVMVLCDFDMTCSAIDTCALLAEIGIVKASKANKLNECETQNTVMPPGDLRSTWSTLHTQYIKGYGQCIENIMLGEKVKVFDYERLCKALSQLSDFEKRANLQVVQSGVLKGLNVDDIKWAGERLVFQHGCREFFQETGKHTNLEIDVHVLSYCWCGDLIRSAFSSGNTSITGIHSNELIYDNSITTGDILKKMESPMEKLQIYNALRKSCSTKAKNLSIYIGGSVGDLLCLLNADIGIVISPGASLKKLGNLFGISFVPLFSGLVNKQREFIEAGSPSSNSLSAILYTVSSWAEIHAFILGS